MRSDLIETLQANNKNEEAGDLLAEASRDDSESMEAAFSSYVKANTFQKAIKFAQMTG